MTDRPSRKNPGDPPSAGLRAISVDDFRLTTTDERYVWAEEPKPGMPLLRWPGGAICEPVYVYFAHSVATGRVVANSLPVQAYALRGWLAWLWQRGIPWDRPTDQLLREWRADRLAAAKQASRVIPGSRPPSPLQVERAISIVFTFYLNIPEAMVLDEAGRPYPAYVGAVGSRCPITSRVVRVETPYGITDRISWQYTSRVPRRRVRRPTPTSADVGHLLEHLRGRAAITPSRRPTRTAAVQLTLVCERDWLGARCMTEAGLRAEEVARLRIIALARALEKEGAPGLVEASDASPRNGAARQRILDRLGALAAAGRRVIEVEVTCKGSTRAAPFPLALVRDLLSIGLWVVREAMLCARRIADLDGPIFVSAKTGRALTAGAVADVMQDGLRKLGLSSSGHRLRAFYAENLAVDLLRERMALNGGILDDSVETWVLRRVADALGHASVTTTVMHYVDRAVLRLGAKRRTIRRPAPERALARGAKGVARRPSAVNPIRAARRFVRRGATRWLPRG